MSVLWACGALRSAARSGSRNLYAVDGTGQSVEENIGELGKTAGNTSTRMGAFALASVRGSKRCQPRNSSALSSTTRLAAVFWSAQGSMAYVPRSCGSSSAFVAVRLSSLARDSLLTVRRSAVRCDALRAPVVAVCDRRRYHAGVDRSTPSMSGSWFGQRTTGVREGGAMSGSRRVMGNRYDSSPYPRRSASCHIIRPELECRATDDNTTIGSRENVKVCCTILSRHI